MLYSITYTIEIITINMAVFSTFACNVVSLFLNHAVFQNLNKVDFYTHKILADFFQILRKDGSQKGGHLLLQSLVKRLKRRKNRCYKTFSNGGTRKKYTHTTTLAIYVSDSGNDGFRG